MSSDTITKTVFFAVGREIVWGYLTEKDKLEKWFHPAEEDLSEGEEYHLYESGEDGAKTAMCWGKVLEMEQPEKLVYSFTVKPLNGAYTTVTWVLEEFSGGTKLTLTHEGVGAAAGEAAAGLLKALDAGWDAHFAKLRKLAV